MSFSFLLSITAEASLPHPPPLLAQEGFSSDVHICCYLQVLLGKLGAMLRGEVSQEEGRVGGQHGRIWAWVYQPLGDTEVHGLLPTFG